MDQLLEGRQREGNLLADMIEQRLVGIEEQVALVRQHLPAILAQQRARLNEKLSDLKSQLDDDRLEQEMVIISNRADVDEELDRLEAHISEIRLVLQKKESIGPPIGFSDAGVKPRSQHLGFKVHRRSNHSGLRRTQGVD